MILLDALRRRLARPARQGEQVAPPARGEEGLGGDFLPGGDIGGADFPAPVPPGEPAPGSGGPGPQGGEGSASR